MGYLYLAAALAAGLVKGFAGKKISRDVDSLADGFSVNIIRTLFCTLIGFAVAICQVGLQGFALTPKALLICLVSSTFMALFCISWLYAYKSEAYIFLNVFTMLASVITGLLGWLIYGEDLKITRILGFLVLFAAVYVMSLYNKSQTGKITKRGALTLILGTLGAALSDFMQKAFNRESLGAASVFTFYTYFLMLIPQLLILLVLRKTTSKTPNPILYNKSHITIFFIISAALFVNVITKTMAASHLPATQMYPTLQGANLIASAIMARLLLKEKLTPRSLLSILLALIAIVLMAL